MAARRAIVKKERFIKLSFVDLYVMLFLDLGFTWEAHFGKKVNMDVEAKLD